jgi:hypothetical protein
MKIRQLFFFVLVSTALLLQACGPAAEAAIATGIAATLQISQLQTAAAGGGGGGGSAPTATSEPGQPTNTSAPSETATITLTPTLSVPMVSVSQNTNCRSGPATSYTLLTTIDVGQEVEVIAVTTFSDYVLVRQPDGTGDCWLWLRYANVTDFEAYNLPVATQPPTPTPTYTPTPSFNWNGDWNIVVKNGGSTYTGSINFTVTGNNISGNATLNPGALPYTFSGTVSASLQGAGGTYGGTGSGDWDAQIKSGNLNQFIGNLDSGTWEFCGARVGSSIPNPCLWP